MPVHNTILGTRNSKIVVVCEDFLQDGPEGKYNYIAYLLADENGVSIKVAKYAGTKYAGTDKVDLIANEEYGYCSLIKSTYHVLEKMKIENITKTRVTSSKRIEKNLVEAVPLREV